MRSNPAWFLTPLLFVFTYGNPVLAADDRVIGLAVYSDLGFVQDEGEFYEIGRAHV